MNKKREIKYILMNETNYQQVLNYILELIKKDCDLAIYYTQDQHNGYDWKRSDDLRDFASILSEYVKQVSSLAYNLNNKISQFDYEDAISQGIELINEANCKFTTQEINKCLGKDASLIRALFQKIQTELQSNNSLKNESFENKQTNDIKTNFIPQPVENRINAIKTSIMKLKKELDALNAEVEILIQYFEVNNLK